MKISDILPRYSFWLPVCLIALTCPLISRGQSNQSTTTESQDQITGAAPTREVVKRTERDGHAVETRIVEGRSINGGYSPVTETEQETIQQNPNTVTVVKRQYSRDSNGNRQLLEMTEEQRTTAAGGRETVVRTTSSADVNGGLQVVQRELEDTVPVGDNTRQTTRTVSRQTANGFQPTQRTQQIEQRKGDVAEQQTTVLAPDANGNFVPVSRTESTVTKTASGKTEDKRTYRDNGLGRMTVVQRDVTTESKDQQGTRSTTQTYSAFVPGATPDPGSLVLVQQVSSSQQTTPDGTSQTKQQTQTINLGNPSTGLQVTTTANGISQPAGNGQRKNQTVVRGSDGNGGFGIVRVTDGHETKVVP